jgi:tetratricopeptide (TPR) repeat protein
MSPDSRASDEIRRFAAQYSHNPDSLVFARLADAYRKAGDPDKALQLLEQGLRRHPDYLSAHIVRARAFRDLGRHDEAVLAFQAVLELDGQNLVAVQGLAALAAERDHLHESKHWYELITQIDPMNLEAAENLRRVEEQLGAAAGAGVSPDLLESDVETESVAAEESVASEPSSAAGAEPDREQAGEAGPEDRFRWHEERPTAGADDGNEDADLMTRTMADLYARQGLYDQAVAIYEELLTDRPDDSQLLAGLRALREEVSERRAAPAAAEAELEWDETIERDIEPDEPETAMVEELRQILRAGEELAAAAPEGTAGPAETGNVLETWLRRLKK